jgi:hypothetical protein
MDYFQPGVTAFVPTAKKTFVGRILPGFDWRFPADSAEFKNAVIPYRDSATEDPETKQGVLNSFFIRVPAYSWFGNAKARFLSPAARRNMVEPYEASDLWDPVTDVRNFALQSANPDIKNLAKKPVSAKEGPVLPYPGWKCLFNYYGHDVTEHGWKNAVIVVSDTGGTDLVDKLSEWRPGIESVVDTEWPDYLFGDITHPETGLLTTAAQIPGNPQAFSGFTLTSGTHKSAQGVQRMAVPPQAVQGRYNIWSSDCLKIYTYQELVDFLVEDGAIPYELVQQACGGRSNVGKKPTSFAAATQPWQTADVVSNAMPAPPTPAPAPAPPAPAPAFIAGKKFWVTDMTTNTVLSGLQTEQDVAEKVSQGAQYFLMSEDQSGGWMPASTFGFMPPAPAAPAPAAPVAMPAPAAPAPAAPAAMPAPAAPVAPVAPVVPMSMPSAPPTPELPQQAKSAIEMSLAIQAGNVLPRTEIQQTRFTELSEKGYANLSIEETREYLELNTIYGAL